MSQDNNESLSRDLGNGAKKAGKQVARGAGNAAKKFIKQKIRAVKTKIKAKLTTAAIKQMVAALIKVILVCGKVLLIILGIVLLFQLAAYIVDVETPGTSGYIVEDSELQNPAVKNEVGNIEAVALLEPHALKDAYYKYMACRSYQKIYADGTDEGMVLEFDYEDEEMLQDFAGLSDYFGREDSFYLSSDFILYADQFLHKDEFYFPEQIIKPVWWEWDSQGYIEAQNLITGEESSYPTGAAGGGGHGGVVGADGYWVPDYYGNILDYYSDNSIDYVTGVDTAAVLNQEECEALKEKGYEFVGRYLVPASYSKAILLEEAQRISNAGLRILTVFEIGINDWQSGATNGALYGKWAYQCARDLNMPSNGIIYFAVDTGVAASQMHLVVEYLNACRAAIAAEAAATGGPVYGIGVYGNYSVIEACADAGACDAYWQCIGGSGGNVSDAHSVFQACGSCQIGLPGRNVAVDLNTCPDMDAAGLWSYSGGASPTSLTSVDSQAFQTLSEVVADTEASHALESTLPKATSSVSTHATGPDGRESVLAAPSYSYIPDSSDPTKKYASQSTTDKEPGVWDYGMGSMLQYEAATVDSYLEYEVQTIDIEYQELNDEGEPGDYVIKTFAITDLVPVIYSSIGLDGSITYNYIWIPASNWLPVSVTGKLQMYLQGEDVAIGKRVFNNTTLNNLFGNGGTNMYPIKVPVLVAAATMSGNMKYDYTQTTTSDPLSEGTSGDIYDAVDTITYATASDGTPLTYYRTGSKTRTAPSPTSVTEDPWGFEYLDDYGNYYVSYVPDVVKQDVSFSKRLDEELIDFLKSLGLLVPYGSGSGEYSAWGPSGYTAEQLDTMIDTYLNGYSGNSLSGCGQDFLDMETEYGINALFAISVSVIEQQLGKANNSHTSHNNFFSMIGSGTAGSWYSSTGRKWSAWSSPRDAIMGFAKNLYRDGSGPYWGKTIYGIGQVYCPNSEVAGQAEGWGAGVMRAMEMLAGYVGTTMESSAEDEFLSMQSGQEIYISGFEPEGYNSPSKVEGDIVMGANPDYPLYKIRAFDVRTATSVLQKSAEKEQSLWDKAVALLDAIGEAIGNAISQAISQFIGNSEPPTKYEFYQYHLSNERVRMMIYHSLGSVNGILSSTVKEQIDSMNEDDIFLFVGKASFDGNNLFGYTSMIVPSILCTVEGMQSPTSQHYTVADSYTTAKGGTVYATPPGTSLKAVADGEVIHVDETAEGKGKSITIKYVLDGVTYEITYGYMQSTMGLKVGDTVTQGQVVGKSGSNPETGEDGYFLAIKEDGSVKNPEEYFYQPSTSGGAGFPNIYNSDGTFNMDAIYQLETNIINLNWFYPKGSSTRITVPQMGAWREGGTPAGYPRSFDKWHDPSGGLNHLQIWQCTWWFRGRASEWLEYYGTKYRTIELPNNGYSGILHGNGGQVYDNNVIEGFFDYGQTPRPYSAIVWGKGSANHIGFVEGVEQNSSTPRIVVSEAGSGIWWRGFKIYDYPYVYSGVTPDGFVYLDSPQ